MSPASVAVAIPSSTESAAVTKTGTKTTPPADPMPMQSVRNALAAHAAIVKSAQDGDKVDKDAVATLVTAVGEQTASVVSRDTVLAHTILLAAFHHQLRDDTNEAKNLAFLCTSEARYLAFLSSLAKAVAEDASLIANPPLPPLDVAMFWHSHKLSPIRYADDMQRCFGSQMLDVDFPLLRMAKVISGANKDDLETARAFWAAHMPASMPYVLTHALIDETKKSVNVICPTCQAKQSMDMAEYASFRLHAKEHMCVSCACEFTAEHVAVNRFLALIARTPAMRLAGTQLHPKTQLPVSNDRANVADVATLFAKDDWAKRVAKLPVLASWDDVKSTVFAPIVEAKRDALVLPGNRFRFGMVLRAHLDVTTGPWSMDMVRAVRRQQRFSSKIAAQLQHGGVHRIYHVHTESLVQYPKFLAMLVAKPRASLVPTTAIDLAWHTHQLFSAKYAAHTMALAGHVVNHDDSDDAVSEERIAEGAKAMPELWMEVFDEDYFAPNVSCAADDKYKVDTLDYHDVMQTFTCGHGHDCADETGMSVAGCSQSDAAVEDAAASDAVENAARCFQCVVVAQDGVRGAVKSAARCAACFNFCVAAQDAAARCHRCVDCYVAAQDAAARCHRCVDCYVAAQDAAARCHRCVDCYVAAQDAAARCHRCVDCYVAAQDDTAGLA